MNLYSQIDDLYRANTEWNYYDADIRKPFDKDKARDFIIQYFENGAKKRVVLPFIDEIDSMRHMHVVSAFFIGLLIKRELCPDLVIFSQKYENYEFSYLWFLVCLFHDMGYAIENDRTYKYTYRSNSEEYLRKHKDIKGSCIAEQCRYKDLGLVFVAPYRYNHFSDKSKENHSEKYEGIMFSNGVTINKAVYSRMTALNYLRYCKMAEGIKHYDHGIVGGLWLYDSLMKNYYIAFGNAKEKNKDAACNDFCLDGHWHFSSEQEAIFAYLADCIISHNMWPANADTIEIYRKYHLDELIYPKFKRISFKDNPILFILAIADTIEPIKLYSSTMGISEEEIWQGIDAIFSRKSVTMKISDDRLSFERLLGKMEGLDNWIDVEVLVDDEEKEVRLEFK